MTLASDPEKPLKVDSMSELEAARRPASREGEPQQCAGNFN
jgi:hypothetical protein